MSELRRDPIIGRWVIIAQDRALRPDQFKRPPTFKQQVEPCSFCAGNESQTPPEIHAIRTNSQPNTAGWKIRVVPNKFPALRVEGSLESRGEGIYDVMDGIGAHEVIIESPEHIKSLTQLSPEAATKLLKVYRERILDLKKDKRLLYCLIFKNVGDLAGASLEHSHSQLIATPIVPLRVQSEINRCRQFYDFHLRCIFCDLIKQELLSAVRVIINSSHFVVLEPFAARFPFETWVLPKRHISHFELTDDALFADLADILRQTIAKIEKVSDNPPYNYLIHTAPVNSPPMEHYHWHLEILPRLTRVAGFEWGTGFYINPVAPEEAAKYLREVKI